VSEYLGCKGATFVFCPETTMRELRVWLRKQHWIRNEYDVTRWAWNLRGHRDQIIAQRFDYQPSLRAHAHGKKIMFTRNGECFVKRIVITNFIALELELGVVVFDDGRHSFYVKKPTLKWEVEEDENTEGHDVETSEGGSDE